MSLTTTLFLTWMVTNTPEMFMCSNQTVSLLGKYVPAEVWNTVIIDRHTVLEPRVLGDPQIKWYSELVS